MAHNDDILIIPDVATLHKVAEKTACGLARTGNLPAFDVGDQWRSRRGAIDSCIEEKTRTAAAQTSRNDAKLSNAGEED